MAKRDPYRNDLLEKEKHIARVKDEIKARRPTRWICWCGNLAEGNVTNGFDADG